MVTFEQDKIRTWRLGLLGGLESYFDDDLLLVTAEEVLEEMRVTPDPFHGTASSKCLQRHLTEEHRDVWVAGNKSAGFLGMMLVAKERGIAGIWHSYIKSQGTLRIPICEKLITDIRSHWGMGAIFVRAHKKDASVIEALLRKGFEPSLDNESGAKFGWFQWMAPQPFI